MLLLLLLTIPLVGIIIILTGMSYDLNKIEIKRIKFIALSTSIANLLISLFIFIVFDFASNQYQFVQEYHQVSYFDFYLGLDGLSIYFVLLTTIIIPIALLSNWTSITENVRSYLVIILLLETLLLLVFLVLDVFLFYIFFESILPPLFILIGLFGSSNRVRASFYLFLYTLLGSLFLLLSILSMSSIMGTTDFDALFKTNFIYSSQVFLFCGVFIAFAVKTPTIFLNTWLLKAHVESPLGGSIILASIVLKLSLYGIFRLILPLLAKAYIYYTGILYLIGVITIIYASISTLRTTDVKELIAYSSVSHAAVYLLGVLSNTVQGIEGGITLGLAHGFVSSGLFICAGGILYDRSSTRLISYYRGIAQIMPLFSVMFFILSLANCGVPLTLNFIGEFMSLYGIFERLPLLGVFASSSIILSAAYTIYMFNRIAFAGSFSKFFIINILDLNKREFFILLTLVVFTVALGIYPAPVLDGLNYSVCCLIYSSDSILLLLPFIEYQKAITRSYIVNFLRKSLVIKIIRYILFILLKKKIMLLILALIIATILGSYYTEPLLCEGIDDIWLNLHHLNHPPTTRPIFPPINSQGGIAALMRSVNYFAENIEFENAVGGGHAKDLEIYGIHDSTTAPRAFFRLERWMSMELLNKYHSLDREGSYKILQVISDWHFHTTSGQTHLAKSSVADYLRSEGKGWIGHQALVRR